MDPSTLGTFLKWPLRSSGVRRTWCSGRGKHPATLGLCTPGSPIGCSPSRSGDVPDSRCEISGQMRAIKRDVLLSLSLRDRRSGWPLEMVLSAHRAGLSIMQTDVPYLPRTGRSKVTGTLRGTVQAVHDMGALLQ